MDKLLRKCIAIIPIIIVTCLSCARKEESCDLVILYTTDVHGNVLPYDFNTNKPKEVSLANASTLIKKVDKEYGKNMLLIDGGDFFQGTPSMYYYNFYSTKEKHLISRVSNYLRYDALVVGNHDLEAGGAMADSITNQLLMPRFGANVIDTRTKRARYRSYKMFERNGFRIAILGLITPETEYQIPKTLIPYMSYNTMVKSAARWVKEIKQNEDPDYIICVAHAGIKDIELLTDNRDTIYDGLSYIMKEVPGIDLLLFGHDHGIYNDVMITPNGDSINVFQSAAYGAEIGRIDIHLSRKDTTVQKTTKMERIDLADIPIDEDYVNTFKGVIDTVNSFLDRPLGYLDQDMDMIGTLYKQTNTMDLIHDIQLDATGADVSFSSALSTFMDLKQGSITCRTVFKLYKYDNLLHKMWMNGKEIRDFLEYGYDRQFGKMTDENSHLLAFNYDKRGNIIIGRFGPDLVTPQYNYTSAAGINYTVDVRKPKGERVKILSMADGTPFDLNRQYTVAISSYQAAGGGGFISRGLGWTKDDIAYHTLTVSKKTMSKLISEYLSAGKHLSHKNVGTWKVLPEEWAEKAGKADAELIVPYLRKQ